MHLLLLLQFHQNTRNVNNGHIMKEGKERILGHVAIDFQGTRANSRDPHWKALHRRLPYPSAARLVRY
jgi:hypothetical protein